MVACWRMARGAGAVAWLSAWALAAPAGAQEQVAHSSVQLRLGETRQIAVFGGHRPDCLTSTPPNAVEIVRAPTLGMLSRREHAPYVVRESLSNTCLGAHLLGTAIDYTATRPGSDVVVMEGVFRNGRARRQVEITVTP